MLSYMYSDDGTNTPFDVDDGQVDKSWSKTRRPK